MSEGAGQFELAGSSGGRLVGTAEGEGPPIVLLHGLTAHRDLVVHGSRALTRAGYRLVRYDARGHGESEGTGEGTYTYEALSGDLGRVLEEVAGAGARVVAVGHSMGAHTIVRHALDHPERFAALVVMGPVARGEEMSERAQAYWDSLADGLAENGIDGFLRALDRDLSPEWREVILRVAAERMGKHQDLDAVANALREVSRSQPVGSLDDLGRIEIPTLVVGSHDEADPGHPMRTARDYADALPDAELISEEEGQSPLVWQGGKLSREIAAFCERRGIPGA